MGPFILFGAGLLMVASWQRNALLAWWAVLAGGLGVFEGFFGITNRLPASVWRTWEHPAIYLALGILAVLAEATEADFTYLRKASASPTGT